MLTDEKLLSLSIFLFAIGISLIIICSVLKVLDRKKRRTSNAQKPLL